MKLKLLVIIALFSNLLNAQKALEKDQFEGYIIDKKGVRSEVIIEINKPEQPWAFQGGIKFFDKNLLSADKIKKDDKKALKTGDYVEYGIGERRFIMVEYSDKNNVNDAGSLNSAIGGFKSLTKQKYFAEVYRAGKVSLYKFYTAPPEFYITSGDAQQNNMEEYIEKCKTTYDILIEKEGEKAKSFEDTNIKKFFKDCEAVVKKYEDGKYIKKPVKGLKSLVKNAMLQGEALRDAAIEIVEDYEATCSMK